MIKCPNCGRENDDSFKFCLDCGNVLRPGGTSQKPAPPVTAPPEPPPEPAPAPPSRPATGAQPRQKSAVRLAVPPPAAAPPPEPEPAPAPIAPAVEPAQPAAALMACPRCNAPAKPGDAFCSGCGQRLAGGETAPKGATMFMHVASPEAARKPRARLVLIKPDGSEGTVFTLAAERTTLGRSQGVIMFPKDPFISPRHAELTFKDGQLSITDLDSLNGVFRKMTAEEPITPGTAFRIGRQLLRLEVPGGFQALDSPARPGDDSQFWGSPVPQVWARLVQILEGGKIGEIHLLSQAEVMIGREEGEVRFPDDGYISSRHCLLSNRQGDCFLRDLGSSNGTYLRIVGTAPLVHDDRIQIGNQVLRVDLA